MTSKLQALDAGISDNFKAHFRAQQYGCTLCLYISKKLDNLDVYKMDQAQAMVFLANAWLKVKLETTNGMLPDLPGNFDNNVTDVSQLNLEADESEMIVCYTTSTTNNEKTAEGNIDETEENDNTKQDEQRVDVVECRKRLREAYETILIYEVPLDDLDRKLHCRIRMRLADSCAELNAKRANRSSILFYKSDYCIFFFLSMENKLKESIRTVVRKNNKKMNEQLAALKQKLSTAKKLPSGIITGAAKLAESTYNEPSQADLILQQMRSFMDNRVGKKNEIEWQEFVVKKFDTSKNEEANLAKSAQLESNDTDRDSVPDADCPAVDENSYRICTASINKLIREDLDPSIKDLIMKKLQRAMIGSTEYILHFSSLIQIMMICLKTNQFFLDGDVINT
ncbi:hypothetical protein G6F49_010554 [Rhizopus delemar]|nr:hypothetical protein G6F49_010554 [Rhizopus delemar]KAG1587501.1 hypothetical protein G6F48_005887 [Rhizopus delemar]